VEPLAKAVITSVEWSSGGAGCGGERERIWLALMWSEVCGGIWIENLDFKESQLYCEIIIIKNINTLIRKQKTQIVGRVKIRIHTVLICKKCVFQKFTVWSCLV
jgi:hypothetical protein